MRSCRLSGIIKAEVCVIYRSQSRGLINFSYPERTELNNCFKLFVFANHSVEKDICIFPHLA